MGATAIGKTELALRMAEEFNGEIIGVDSMQIYRYMDIGTAKPTSQERARVPHHLVDFVDPKEDYSVACFIRDCAPVVEDLRQRGKVAIMAGGTGLYFQGWFHGMFKSPPIPEEIRQRLEKEYERLGRKALYERLTLCDPVSAQRIHPNDKLRLLRALEIYETTGRRWSDLISEHRKESVQQAQATGAPLKIGLRRERQELYERINKRAKIMIDSGLLQEVEGLLRKGYSPELNAMQSLGYRHMVNYIEGRWSMERSLELLARDTRRYAKRQFTWFNKVEDICWFHPDDIHEILQCVNRYLSDFTG